MSESKGGRAIGGERLGVRKFSGDWRGYAVGLGLALGMLVLYHANGDFLPGNDATANLYLPVNLLRGRGLSFQPAETPQMFLWRIEPPAAKQPEKSARAVSRRTVRLTHWDRPVDEKSWQWLQKVHSIPWTEPPTWRQLQQAGWLQLAGPEYYLVPSKDPDRFGYVNQYGPGAGLTALPVLALVDWWTGDLEQRPAALWYGGKFAASLCTALSVGLVYLTLCRMTKPLAAFLIAFVYGTGTCVWSMSSQTLWQSGPNVLFLALAVYCLVHTSLYRPTRTRREWAWTAAAGLSAGWAVVCRPTSALVAAAVAGALLVRALLIWRIEHLRKAGSAGDAAGPSAASQACGGQSPSPQAGPGKTAFALGALGAFVLGLLPPAAFLAGYNTYYLGAPWRFGQVEAGRRIAQDQLGDAAAWSGNFLEGLYGQLISPARGLLVYSPILGFSIWGMALACRKRRYRLLRPLAAAVLLLLLVQSKWFNWHGGWSFGYRLMVDAMPLAAVCAAPTVRWMRRYWSLAALAGVLAAWSIGVQILGAFAYDVVSWNCREGLVVRLPDGRAVPVADKEEAAALARQTGGAVQTVLMDVDRRPWHGRLWSVRDNPIQYYLTHFWEARQRKHQLIQSVLQSP
ncbi:MAG TPA: glycosyltransferase family 39 protein [Thermoguttaceae bacterium]|nr:glycosyltransferase family 39 protein [Thermoguttaceae bacterium]